MREKEQIETIEPEFWETLSDKQKEAVRHIAKRYRPDGVGRKFINIRFNFWLFKPLFLVFIVGAEKRSDKRKHQVTLAEGFLMDVLRFLFYVVLTMGVIALVFLIVYALEVWVGIDVIAGVDMRTFFQ
jgi:hypothetical protein